MACNCTDRALHPAASVYVPDPEILPIAVVGWPASQLTVLSAAWGRIGTSTYVDALSASLIKGGRFVKRLFF
jgi:hypothetical protein